MRIDDEVLNVLGAATADGNRLVLGGQLDRKLYERTAKVLEAAGGRWNRAAKAHLFDADVEAAARVDEMIATGSVVSAKTELGAFYTPPAVVDLVMAAAGVEQGQRVLEPSAGTGALALAAWQRGASVDAVEIHPPTARQLQAGGPRMSLSVTCADFLSMEPRPVYDRVVMNPPFARQDDVRHVRHALQFLATGGRLVSVMGAGVVFRDNRLTADFRALVRERGGFIEPLPDGSFLPSGTGVRTALVTIPAEAA